MNLVKTVQIYESEYEISGLTGNFTDLSTWLFFVQNGVQKVKTQFKNEVIDADGTYQGSLNDGRWSGACDFAIEAGHNCCPALLMKDGEIDFVIWSQNSALQTAPSCIQEKIVSIQWQDDNSIELVFANYNGIFTNAGTKLGLFFTREKSSIIYMGYNGELTRIATSQIDKTRASRSYDGSEFICNFINKYTQLITLPMSKIYDIQYPQYPKTSMVTGISPSSSIAAGAMIEMMVQAPNGKRWYPGTARVENLTNSDVIEVLGPYGQSECFCFVMLRNNGDSAVTPTFAIAAVDSSDLGEKVLSGSITITLGNSSADKLYYLATNVYCVPSSYQIVMTSVSGAYSDLSTFLDACNPVRIPFDPATNALGVQIILYDDDGNLKPLSDSIFTGRNLKIYFDIYGRKYVTVNGATVKPDFGTPWTAKEVLFDLTKLATRKELLLASSNDVLDSEDLKMSSGEASKIIIMEIEEEFDPVTVRAVNKSENNIQVEIIEAGWIVIDDSGNENWAARVAATRGNTSLEEKSFAFEIWGQYPQRNDFFFPLQIDLPDELITQFSEGIKIEDSTIEDGINKVLQVCFDEEDVQFTAFYNHLGHMQLKPYRIDEVVAEITAKNMEEVVRNTASPNIIDRVEVLGEVSEAYVLSDNSMTLIHTVSSTITCPRFQSKLYYTIEFNQSYDKSTIELRNVSHDSDSKISLSERSYNYCIIKIKNKEEKIDLVAEEISLGYIHEAKLRYCEVWGRPLNVVKYQQNFTYKTTPGTSGKYTYTEATIDNELINSNDLADKVGNYEVIKSANDQLVYALERAPFNPSLEMYDTIQVYFEELDLYHEALVIGLSAILDVTGDAPSMTMDIEAIPFDRFISGVFGSGIEVDDEYEIDSNYEIDSLEETIEIIKLFFG